jgi:hypothetical protein
MEPIDDPQLKKLLREWRVENAPRALDDRVLGVGQPWWRRLISGSVRVPVPVALAVAMLFLAMGVALVRPRPVPPPAGTADSSSVNLAEFQPVRDVQVRIIRGSHARQ